MPNLSNALLRPIAAWALVLLAATECRPEAPEAPADTDAGTARRPAAVIYSYADDSGRIRMAAKISDIPERFRGRVVVSDAAAPATERLARDRALVVDARTRGDGENFSLVDLRAPHPARSRAGGAKDPGGLGRAAVDRLMDGLARHFGREMAQTAPDVVLYETSWCGFCKKARAWLRARRIPFEAVDVEADADAAAELDEKLRRAGVEGAGVPVIDVRGTLLVGFDPDRLARLLSRASGASTEGIADP
jgi:glutaredoxin